MSMSTIRSIRPPTCLRWANFGNTAQRQSGRRAAYHTLGKSKYDQLGLDYPLEGIKQATMEQARQARSEIPSGHAKSPSENESRNEICGRMTADFLLHRKQNKKERFQFLSLSSIYYFKASAIASATSLPEVSAQPLFAPDGESSPITPPTVSPAAYKPGITVSSILDFQRRRDDQTTHRCRKPRLLFD